ncbi:hypothetical protein PYW08_010810 [Mythimna loreyi]|uniref:Uncharacterized protein n=1 Tax=Mythimna loreyi TaxID=667449 RepID=A0ACC2Q400_9NEOP|nr:hypothetical protein PYW08_010810 [Mythimna loreyi]
MDELVMVGLLDSGSAVTIIGNNAHKVLISKGLHLTANNSYPTFLIAAGGQRLNSIGSMNLPIHFEDQFHIIEAQVVPEINNNLILGIDFWRKFQICPKYLYSISIGQINNNIASVNTDNTHLQNYDTLDTAQRVVADNIIRQFEEISFKVKGLGNTNVITHRIDTGDTQPIRQRYYRMSPEKQRILIEQVDEMLSLDVVEPCESAWSSPVLIVTKKNGEPRFCLDSRKLNSVTKKDAYNLPYISEILDNLRDARYLSSIDLSKAFWQINIHPEDRDKTAFYVPGRGTFRFKRTAFGLTNAPATQQRLVDTLFGEFEQRVFAFLDDIIIVSNDFNSHVSLLECLISAPVLSCPDYNRPFEVHTDASNYGIGAMLTQTINSKEHPIAYMSRSLSASERNYSITERETLAVITALEHWRCYLENGKMFTVYTDHSALKWFLSLNNPTGRLARWGVRLSSFHFEIKHRRGSDNVVPDALSRAVPVSAISTSDAIKTTNDSWYSNIYNGCINNPQNFQNFIVKNNKLFRLSKEKCQFTTEFSWKEVIPSELREQVIFENHSEPIAGHLGIFKTYRRLALRYYWPGMHKDVVNFVSACDKCLSHKIQNHTTLGEMGRPKCSQCSRPFQMLSIDLMGPLPTTRKQNSYIFVVTCCFSKFCLIFPIRNATSQIITKILEDSVFLVHGVPQTVFLDNGTQFTSNLTESLFKKYNIPNIYFTPKYTPQVNTVERYNRTIITCLSTFIDDDQRSWDTKISSVQFAINNSVNEATGYTPSFLVYGRELITCGSHYVDNEVANEVTFLPRDVYAENLGCLSKIFDNVQFKLWQAHVKNTSHYNLRRKPAEFKVGDVVMKRAYVLSDKDKYFSKKLAPKYIKCRITGKKSPLVYILADMSGKDLGTWHIKDIKLANNY